MTTIGIEDYGFATGSRRFELADLAEHEGIDANKYLVGIGQEAFSVPTFDEDIVTLAASAATTMIDRLSPDARDSIRTLIVATESGIDQSKAAAIYVHELLELGPHVRAFEIKQACYGGTAALATAQGIVARHPDERVLIVATDIARYDPDSSGEATQGGAAVALLISASPRILAFDKAQGLSTEDAMDFWRPNYRTTARVDGRLSIQVYIRQVLSAWDDYSGHGGRPFTDLHTLCYHQPFTKMASKAHLKLARHLESGQTPSDLDAQLAPTFRYNRIVGNSYTASMYVGFLGLIEHADDLAGRALGFVSYGSGAMCEVFSGEVLPTYLKTRHTEATTAMLDARQPVDFATYRELYYGYPNPTDGSAFETPHDTSLPFRLAGIDHDERRYATSA